MYENEHRFFASALVVSLAACVAFSAALSLVPTQKAYADASGFESGVLSLLNSIYTYQQWIYGSVGDASGEPTLIESNSEIVYTLDQIYSRMGQLTTNNTYMKDLRDALAADSMTINGQTFKTPRGFLNDISDRTDSMTTILQAWNRDMGASQNGTGTNATWFSTVSSSLLAMVNAINSANTNLISIDSKFWEYFLVPQRWQQQDGSYYYSPAYYFQFLKLQYDRMQSYFLTDNQITVDGTNYRTPHFYLDKIYDFVNNIDYYVPKIYTDADLFVKLFSQDTVTINGQSVNTPYYYIKNALDAYNGHTLTFWLEKIFVTLTQTRVANPYSGQTGFITTARGFLEYINNSIGGMANGWQGADSQMYERFRQSWNSFVVMLKDYLDSLVYLLETPDNNTSQQLIGDFDDDAYEQNMQQLRQQLGQIGVYSAVTSLGMIVYTISDADTLQTPSLDVPFEFAGSNDHLVIDLSWLDDFKPMINFACMALLFLQLAAWTVEAVKQT